MSPETCFIHPRLSSFSPLLCPDVCVSCAMDGPPTVHLLLLSALINTEHWRTERDAIVFEVIVHRRGTEYRYCLPSVRLLTTGIFKTAVQSLRRTGLLLCRTVMGREVHQQGLNLRYYNSWISAPSAGHFPLPCGSNRKLINSLVIKIALSCRAIEIEHLIHNHQEVTSIDAFEGFDSSKVLSLNWGITYIQFRSIACCFCMFQWCKDVTTVFFHLPLVCSESQRIIRQISFLVFIFRRKALYNADWVVPPFTGSDWQDDCGFYSQLQLWQHASSPLKVFPHLLMSCFTSVNITTSFGREVVKFWRKQLVWTGAKRRV